ncbi:TetR family transcriptional regulator [Streptomyces sp. NRRL F-4489]|uniref:TetR/AcrR family transcriptional regulator n=1 Tax=Streptomyces sp. NRRL F-4489 TaxID=1609095 RepID=UPI0007463A23|nr:TetR/AcrR family transcriptional regulator [Streptomyces sp. NRRL F-4489]KUL52642.1 TetR family transcriptional regulator [Streptomyces sp. NRRL F-4489]
MGTAQPRRGNTRQRIQDVALELFSDHGYEKTSLREISEKLGVTKAALYYHFKTKEDIVLSLFEDLGRPIDELIAWGKEQPRTLETKQEIVRRYHDSLRSGEDLFRFMQENQAAVRDLTIGARFKERMFDLFDLLKEDDAEMVDQVRCLTALFAMHAGLFAMQHVAGDPEEKREAILRVATELVTAANPPGRRPA